MSRGLSYSDAVVLLGGSGPLGRIADNLLGGALTLATAGGSDVALSLFDARTEAVRLGRLVTGRIAESVYGVGRYDRSLRLQAAHGVLVVSAFFEALDECLAAAGVGAPGFGKDEQILLVARSRADGDWLGRLLAARIPVPSADHGFDRLLRELHEWYAALAGRLLDHLAGLAVWESAGDRARRDLAELLRGELPGLAARRYEESIRRLSAELPEFALWLRQSEDRAATRGLERLEATLLRVSSSRDPGRHRAALSAAYRAELDRPILGGGGAELVIPTLAAAYLDPRFRAKPAGSGSRPADDGWWDTDVRADLAGLLAAYLTSPQAAEAPLLLLGQPGAGKSSLTRILAARLPAADFLVVRVALRDVRAEAEIQDQLEQALRATIGETVAWADLARDAAGAMPVILLDGFDELLQATGIHQSDYLQRVAAFQEREAVLGRPVAVVVTSRVAVADRARVPAGTLAVRLEPFDEAQLERWVAVWNAANPGRPPLAPRALRRYPDLAAQPLLLLMLALYHATGNALSDDGGGEPVDSDDLYERLLSEFAAREVRRMHPGLAEDATGRLIEAELLRLSVVAFAMFHRLRLWATTDELDADLAGLGLRPTRAGGSEDFRTPLTAGQEMVGRFFFIQRAQALRDEQTLQTYEFLHATFGEYLVARLVTQAVTDAAARSRARTLRLGPSDDDDLLQSLIGFTPLSARTTVLPFATALLRRAGAAGIRPWLVDRLRAAVIRPQYVPRAYQPVDKRTDHWLSTYSFNLLLLTLACGEPLRASELYDFTPDPAGRLRDMALQWRAAVPSGMLLNALETMTVTRTWTGDRRDLVLEAGAVTVTDVDPLWSRNIGPASPLRRVDPGSGFTNYFPLPAALNSMQLSNALSDDALRHALDPLLGRLPDTVMSFVLHAPDDAESVAHSLVQLWVASASGDDPARLVVAYDRAVAAVRVAAARAENGDALAAPAILLRSLAADAGRLPRADVIRLFDDLRPHLRLTDPATLVLTVECLAGVHPGPLPETLPPAIAAFTGEQCLRLLHALTHADPAATEAVLPELDRRLAALGATPDLTTNPDLTANPALAASPELGADPDLAGRIARARARLTAAR